MEATEIKFAKPFLPLIEKRCRYKVYYGGRGGGKSFHFAIALLKLAVESKVRVLCTREIQNTIKDSVHKLLGDLANLHFPGLFDIKHDSIVSKVGSEFIFKGLSRNIQEIKSMQGIKYCWVEEAHSASEESLDILLPTIREENSELWFSFNRFSDRDPVWTRFCSNPPKDALVIKVNYYDNPFFPKVLRKEMEHDKETDYDKYLHIWEGEPLAQLEDAILDRASVMEAMKRKMSGVGGHVVGADIARFGDDKTVFYRRKGLKVIDQLVLIKKDVVDVARRLKRFTKNKNTRVNIDDTGVGGGVSDILMKDGYQVQRVNFGAKAKRQNRYANMISEMWFEFASMINDVSIPNDDELYIDLTNRLFKYDRRERKLVEPKKDFKERVGRSPDKADALLLCFYERPMMRVRTI